MSRCTYTHKAVYREHGSVLGLHIALARYTTGKALAHYTTGKALARYTTGGQTS